jgi:hypothetical protein
MHVHTQHAAHKLKQQAAGREKLKVRQKHGLQVLTIVLVA